MTVRARRREPSMLGSVLLASVFATTLVPLVVVDGLVFPFVSGKGHLLRLLVAVAVPCAAALAVRRPELRPRSSPILVALTVFVAVLGVAGAAGVCPIRSLLGDLERMEGWVGHLHLLGLFLVLPVALTDEGRWRRYFQTSLAVSVVVTAVALAQLAGLVGMHKAQGRIDGTLGNPSFLAATLAFHIWLAVYLASAPSTSTRLRTAYGAAAVVEGVGLFFTATRGAILGVVAGIVVVAVLVLGTASRRTVARRVAAVALIAVSLATAALLVLRDHAVVASSPMLSRLTSISPSEETSQSRLLAWGGALAGAAERPWLGWGQESFQIVYARHYDPRLYTQDPFFDRAHNVYLEWLVAAGVPGLVAFTAIMAAWLTLVWRARVFSPVERCLLTGLAAGYAVQGSFLFDTVTSYVPAIVMLAWVHWRVTASRPPADPGGGRHRRRWLALALGAAVLAAVSVGLTWRTVSAELAIRAAARPGPRGPVGSLEAFERALRHRTPATGKARERLLTTAVAIARSAPPGDPAVARLAELGWLEMDRQIRECPLGVRPRVALASFLWRFGAFDEAEALLEQAHALAPRMQHILFELGTLRLERGRRADALATFRSAYELEPRSDEARRRYAAAAFAAGRRELADELLAPDGGLAAASDEWLVAAIRAGGDLEALVAVLERRISWFELEGWDPSAVERELSEARRALAEQRRGLAEGPDATSR